ncbi:MAG: 6,7-dimethyl-8-ribityllumazine synthase [Candidatus Sericytochromatia bacterium]|nr:6,7-dimethyl-8-ribityllumazine synthase [Candidatus Tanganyikabacteria bacterium]
MSDRLEGGLSGTGRRFAIVASRFNDLVVERLVAGARDALLRHGVAAEDLVEAWAPGAFELPVVTAGLLRDRPDLDGIVVLGCVIRGDTAHFEHVASPVAAQLAALARESVKPVGFGVLTTDTLEQALQRAGAKAGNKGWEAAMAVLETANLLIRIQGAPLRR